MAVVTFSNIKGGGGSGTPSGITFLNSDYTLEFIESAVTEAVDSALTAYTRTEDFATINGSAITEGGDLTIEAVPYTAGTNIDITDHVISVTGITVPTDISDLNDDIGIATTAWTNSAITNATSGLATEQYVDDAVSGKMDTSAMSAYTPTSGFSTINGSAITSGDNLIIEGTPYSGGTGIGVENHIISVTGDYETVVELTQDEYDALTAYSENTTYIITDAPSINMSAYTPTSGFSTINGSAITSGGNITIEEVPYSAGTNINISDHVISVTGITVPTKVSELQNDEGFITTADTQNFVTSGDVKTQIEGYNYINSGDAQTQIDNSISGKVDTSALTEYYTSAQTDTAIENATSAFTTSADVKTQIEAYNYVNSGDVQSQINDSISGKVDTSAMTAYWTSAETESAITAATEDFVTSAEVETQITDKGYITGYTETDPVFQSSPASGISAQDILDWDAKLDSSDLIPYYTSAETDTAISNAVSGLATEQYVDNSVSGKVDTSAMTQYYTSAQTDTQISNATSGKQDTLISGTNIKTINNESILGSGNIVISGGSGSANIIELTQAEYDALTAYTEDAMYVITDAQEINMDNYATTGDIQTALDSYYTSAQTDTAIANATSGKTDKISVTASWSGYKFPAWNNQGCITGTTGTVYLRSMTINGTAKDMVQATNSSFPGIYAPTSAGTAGQPLLSNGSGAPVWGSYKFQFISQSAYDAITTKDSTTIYFIISEN